MLMPVLLNFDLARLYVACCRFIFCVLAQCKEKLQILNALVSYLTILWRSKFHLVQISNKDIALFRTYIEYGTQVRGVGYRVSFRCSNGKHSGEDAAGVEGIGHEKSKGADSLFILFLGPLLMSKRWRSNLCLGQLKQKHPK